MKMKKKMYEMIFGGENVLMQIVKKTENCSITHAHKNHHPLGSLNPICLPKISKCVKKSSVRNRVVVSDS